LFLKAKTKLRLLVLLAFFLFLASIFLPLIEARRDVYSVRTGFREERETLWSFKKTEPYSSVPELWFFNLWSKGGWWIWIFGAQVSTVLFALLAIVRPHEFFLLLSTVFSFSIVFYILFLLLALKLTSTYYFKEGFMLTLLSAVLFFVAFKGAYKMPRGEF
jgi:hypothetical protein